MEQEKFKMAEHFLREKREMIEVFECLRKARGALSKDDEYIVGDVTGNVSRAILMAPPAFARKVIEFSIEQAISEIARLEVEFKNV